MTQLLTSVLGGAIVILILRGCFNVQRRCYDYFPQYIVLAELVGVARRVLLQHLSISSVVSVKHICRYMYM